MKYLIVCLGNIGAEYANTRHNIGFMIGDRFNEDLKGRFKTRRLVRISELHFKGHSLFVIKPTTYMNLSGKAVKYWVSKEKIPLENIIVVLDDVALPLSTVRLRKKGHDAGHNGLSNIIECLGTNEFPRLRFGIGNDFPYGKQIDYVLGEWKPYELDIIKPKIDIAVEIIKSFVTQGIEITMNQFNNK